MEPTNTYQEFYDSMYSLTEKYADRHTIRTIPESNVIDFAAARARLTNQERNT